MHSFLPLGAVVLAGLAASPALAADAVTYEGTLGKSPIVVELSAPLATASGKLVGRYFYRAKGIDIPLQPEKVSPGKADLAEERPCTTQLCHTTDNGDPAGPAPLGGKWHLVAGAGGAVTGTWSEGNKSFPIALTKVGTRALPDDFDGTTLGLEAIVEDQLVEDGATVSNATSPYDYLKVGQAAVPVAAPTTWPGGSFRYAVDPRTKFAFPRITDLGGADMKPANAYLAERQMEMSLDALDCEAEVYQGFGWNESGADAFGTLGQWDEEQVTVNYLSPKVMSWNESGSLFCGGAHPDNHDEAHNLDVRTGKPLDLSLIFKDWLPTPIGDTSPKDLASARANPSQYIWHASARLQKFVIAHLPKDQQSTDADANSGDCPPSGSFVADNLDLTFIEGDKVRFTIDGLPNVVEACGGKLFDLPIADLANFLTPEAADYFPSLKSKQPS